MTDLSAIRLPRVRVSPPGDGRDESSALWAENAALRMQLASMEARICALEGNRLADVEPSIRRLARQVAAQCGLSLAQLLSDTRVQRVSWPRQDFMRLAQTDGHSLYEISEFLGMDRTSVRHGIAASALRHKRRGAA